MRDRKRGLPPIIGGQPGILILGSMPGEASLQHQQYYGHARNAFWPIMTGLLGLTPQVSYAERAAALIANGIALWDVIAECERRGSSDARILPDSVRVNDFGAMFAKYPSIGIVAFNGATAEREYLRRVRPLLAPRSQRLETIRLPSTSPAYAGLRLADKARAWERALQQRGLVVQTPSAHPAPA